MLLDEVHHRVKNNLQIISSLLGLSAKKVDSEELRSIIADMRQRVHSLSLVHDKLYRSNDLASVQIGDYISSLVHTLVGSYAAEGHQIGVLVEATGIVLRLEHAVPCALIVNELVTNSFKYAFPDSEKSGEIRVTIESISPGKYRMEVSDNGVGLPPAIDLTTVGSLGLRIVTVLAGQLGASVQFGRKGGTRFRFEFPEESSEAEHEQ